MGKRKTYSNMKLVLPYRYFPKTMVCYDTIESVRAVNTIATPTNEEVVNNHIMVNSHNDPFRSGDSAEPTKPVQLFAIYKTGFVTNWEVIFKVYNEHVDKAFIFWVKAYIANAAALQVSTGAATPAIKIMKRVKYMFVPANDSGATKFHTLKMDGSAMQFINAANEIDATDIFPDAFKSDLVIANPAAQIFYTYGWTSFDGAAFTVSQAMEFSITLKQRTECSDRINITGQKSQA